MTTQAPLLSICIPTYDRYETLISCLEKLHTLKLSDLEIVISDNTQSGVVPKEITELTLCDSRFKYFRQSSNIGMIANNTFVRQAAKGEFVCVIHDDDEIPESYFQTIVDDIRCNPEINICGSACDRYYDDQYWYSYENFSSVGVGQEARLREIIRRAFNSPWDFEHLMYGIYRRSALPSSFSFGPWRSIITFFYLLSISGAIHTEPSIVMRKNNTPEDTAKYAKATYVTRNAILRTLCRSTRQEQRIITWQRLTYFTMKSKLIPFGTKRRLLAQITREFWRNQQESGSPPVPDRTLQTQE